MKFTLTHTRALAGTDLQVAVEADEGKAIRRVETKLDGFTLVNDALEVPSDSYVRTFLGVGDAHSGAEHRLIVSAEQDDGKVHNAISVWTDAI